MPTLPSQWLRLCSPVGEDGCVGPSSQVYLQGQGVASLEDAQSYVTGPGISPLTPSSAGWAQTPCLNGLINSQAQKLHEGLDSLPLDEQHRKAEAPDPHNGLVCRTSSFLPPTLYTSRLYHSLLFLSPALPLLGPLRHYSSKVLKSKSGNLSDWPAQEASPGQAHWSQLP